MNFFEQQDRAKRNTNRLILLLVLAVISLIAITCLMFALFFYYFAANNPHSLHEETAGGFWQGLLQALPPDAIAGIALAVTLVVLLGSLFKYSQLSAGGRTVAAAMGGHLITGATQDPDERKILNVVEEMAIASGTAVPPVYVIEEDSINAFAAGFKPQDAVIGVTRGCIHQLSRDQLQGVIAHEFSHIFHGDMRINMRLVALLNGILLLGLIGEFLMRSTRSRSLMRSSKDKSAAGIMLLGLGLFIIGYTGTFFGNLIKAAVSRQREFLADASAVQFTRNPEGISGALKKIGGATYGSQLTTENAAQFSHMYFSQGVSNFFNLMATHPPLEERIRRIEPRWDGEFIESAITDITSPTETADSAMGFNSQSGNVPAPDAETYPVNIEQSIENIAQPTSQHLDYAHDCLASLPSYIKDAAADPFSARALVFGLLLDRQAQMREQQWQILSEFLQPQELDNLHKLALGAHSLSAHQRLPLLELIIPTLKQLTLPQLNNFLAAARSIINADQKISLMEWSLYRIVLHNTEQETQPVRSHSLPSLAEECRLMFSTLAYAGAKNDADAKAAYSQAIEQLRLELEILPKTEIKLADLDKALNQLNQVKPLQKPQLLKAMSKCVLHDGQITVAEAEMFRAIADSLDCPIPPLIITSNPR
jgi:Zn-dependent protease with chaperone function/uncharacterized tellurite resistance protein B-like protein